MDESCLRAALNDALAALGPPGSSGSNTTNGSEPLTCAPRALPDRLAVSAARTAYRVNPMNGPVVSGVASALSPSTDVGTPLRIALLTSKYWESSPRVLTVSFLEPTEPDLRARILSHMNAWSARGCISFAETASGGDVRITREGDGYWSYLGTDIKHIPPGRPTMSLQAFSMDTPESEYTRVVRHETGHTLGFPHEHMRRELVERIDREKAYVYFERTQGWNRAMVDAQVLTALDDHDLVATRADDRSIMCYQLPGAITKDGRPIIGGLDIDESDYRFVAQMYPKPVPTDLLPAPRPAAGRDWPASEDVLEPIGV